jgi:hypothetical protein
MQPSGDLFSSMMDAYRNTNFYSQLAKQSSYHYYNKSSNPIWTGLDPVEAPQATRKQEYPT